MRMSNLLVWVGWNVFLALIPVALGYYICDLTGPSFKRNRPSRRAWIVLMGLVWLAFLPNTCYLLTEWRHFLDTLGYSNLPYRWHTDSGALVELMMHTLFYLCYSSIGMLTFALAIRPIAKIFREAGANLWVWGLPLFMLNSVGVYLGLVLRFNSWEMITRLGMIWSAVTMISYKPLLTSFIIAFAGFLWIGYVIVDIWVDGFVSRLQQMSPDTEN